MYGMNYSGKWWYFELVTFLFSEGAGFRQSELDRAFLVQKELVFDKSPRVQASEDCLYFDSKKNGEKRPAFENQVSDHFDAEFKGLAHWFLSMRIARGRFGNYPLDQSPYALVVYIMILIEKLKISRQFPCFEHNRMCPFKFQQTVPSIKQKNSSIVLYQLDCDSQGLRGHALNNL